MNNELKPCPFCGASYDKDEDDFVYAADHDNWCPLRGMAYGGYGLTVGDTEEEIDAWNTRAERTCKMIPNGETDFAATLACSVCGNVESVYAISADEFNYCPSCGAKVVE